jgi:ribonuclease R
MSFENQLLQFMASPAYRPMKQHELANALHINQKGVRSDFRHELYALEQAGKITRLRKNRWSLPNQDNHRIGVVKMLAKGGAIFLPDDAESGEVFIGERNTGLALPNDKVAIEVFHSEYVEKTRTSDQRSEGRVVKVLQRHTTQLVGLLRISPYHAYVIPDNPGFKNEVHVRDYAPGLEKTPQNHKVLIELHEWTDPYQPITGTVIEDLGEMNEPGVDVDSILREAGVQEAFPPEVIAEADGICETVSEADLVGREDLRELVTFTIDPETAKDYDDAISIEPHPDGGWWLGVHIADVSHFVKPGTELDKEAFHRGNSIYLVDRCVMMLPRELTTKVCSLNPKDDHLTHTAMMHISEEGEMISYDTYPSCIHSKCRLTYTQVQCYIDGKEEHGIPDFIIDRIKVLYPLVRRVRALRVANGSVEINTPDIEIKLDEEGKVVKMMPRSLAKEAYQLIEDCMLLANKAVAKKLIEAEHPAIYRIHGEPDEEQWATMGVELQTLGIDILPKNRDDINRAVKMAEGTPVEYTANLAILRNFKRAEYSEKQIGHFGLAFEDYTHFTSPIRRYPDLLVHRMLKAVEKGRSIGLSNEKIAEIAKHCTETEKQADDLEKKSIETKRLDYYKELLEHNDIPAKLKGYIVGIKGRGMIIELPDSLQRGMIAYKTVTSDWLEANDAFTQVVTKSGKVKFKLGDEVEVCLAKVDTARNFLDFVFSDQVAVPVRRERRTRIEPDFHTGEARKRGPKKTFRSKRRR